MKEKIFDLNARRDQTAALIKLQDREFRITRVVIAARVLYSNYLSEVSSFFRDVKSLNEKEMTAQELEAKYNDFSQSVPERLSRIIEIILTSNGYEFDRLWWENNADTADMRDFIDLCMTKDAAEGSAKKK